MTSTDPDHAALVRRALRAPQDVSVVEGAEGRVAQIERDDAYPGARRVYLDPTDEDAPVQAQWRLPATANRPSFYPPELPFIPGISAYVIEGDDGLMATWRDDACPRPQPEDLEALRTHLPGEVSDLVTSVREGSADPERRASEFVEKLSAIRDRLNVSEVADWLAGLSKDRVPDDRFVMGFESALDEMRESGWVEAPAHDAPRYAVRSTTLTRDDRERSLVLTAVLGVGSLMLSDKPRSQ